MKVDLFNVFQTQDLQKWRNNEADFFPCISDTGPVEMAKHWIFYSYIFNTGLQNWRIV